MFAGSVPTAACKSLGTGCSGKTNTEKDDHVIVWVKKIMVFQGMLSQTKKRRTRNKTYL